MTKEITKLTEFQYMMLTKIAAKGEHIYGIERNQAKSLVAKGLLERRGNTSYFLTSRAQELMAAYTPRPKRKDPTKTLVMFVNNLKLPGVSRADIEEHLEKDSERKTDTSRRFIRSKGRRLPRDKGKA